MKQGRYAGAGHEAEQKVDKTAMFAATPKPSLSPAEEAGKIGSLPCTDYKGLVSQAISAIRNNAQGLERDIINRRCAQTIAQLGAKNPLPVVQNRLFGFLQGLERDVDLQIERLALAGQTCDSIKQFMFGGDLVNIGQGRGGTISTRSQGWLKDQFDNFVNTFPCGELLK